MTLLTHSKSKSKSKCKVIIKTNVYMIASYKILQKHDCVFCNYKYIDYVHSYEGGSESSVIGVITLLIDIIGCCIIP